MNLAQYVKCLKKYALNLRISDEKFLNAVLNPYIIAGRISQKNKKENKNGEECYFDKSKTSLILNRHDDVPNVLREALSLVTIYEDTEDNFSDFIDDYLKKEELPSIISEISTMISEDKNIEDSNRILCKKDNPSVFLADALIECIKLRNDCLDSEGELIRNGTYSVRVIYDDLFKFAFRKRAKDKNIVVIPVDTEFHTHVTRQYENNFKPEVSEKTIHGQWLIRWEQSGEKLDNLPDRIRKSIRSSNRESKQKRYPIGTIAVIESDNTIYYLLAISDFDNNNNARSTKGNIDKVIEELADFYDKYGDGLDIYIPLIGTGKSRAALSLQESYDGIVNYYRENKYKIQGNINIVVHKDNERLINIEGGKVK